MKVVTPIAILLAASLMLAACSQSGTNQPASQEAIAEEAGSEAQGGGVGEFNQRLDTLFGAHEPVARFFNALQKAVEAGDRQAVAALVSYPLTVNGQDGSRKIADAEDFIAQYDRIITPGVAAAVKKQRYEKLFANAEGVMIGDGEIWFSPLGDGRTVRIIAINR